MDASETKIKGLLAAFLFLMSASSHGFVISFEASDFALTPTKSNVVTFSFTIDVDAPLVAGVYANPTLNSVQYNVFGQLVAGTPSGFPAFDLQRSIGGAEFYAQGSSLAFEIAAGADLSDGLQLAELVGSDPVFVFNGREVDTGRYHPALFELNADGTGTMQNSNNQGGVNPGSGMVVDVTFGDEYITQLNVDPSSLTLAPADPVVVPLPMTIPLLVSGLLSLVGVSRIPKKA